MSGMRKRPGRPARSAAGNLICSACARMGMLHPCIHRPAFLPVHACRSKASMLAYAVPEWSFCTTTTLPAAARCSLEGESRTWSSVMMSTMLGGPPLGDMASSGADGAVGGGRGGRGLTGGFGGRGLGGGLGGRRAGAASHCC